MNRSFGLLSMSNAYVHFVPLVPCYFSRLINSDVIVIFNITRYIMHNLFYLFVHHRDTNKYSSKNRTNYLVDQSNYFRINNFSRRITRDTNGIKRDERRLGKEPFLPTKGRSHGDREQGFRLHLGQVYRCPIAVAVSRFIKTAVALPL